MDRSVLGRGRYGADDGIRTRSAGVAPRSGSEGLRATITLRPLNAVFFSILAPKGQDIRSCPLSRKLKNIVSPLSVYLQAQRGFKLPGEGDDTKLPPPLEIRKRCGEALLVQEFFAFMGQIGLVDAARQLELWDILIARGTYLLDLAQRIGLMNHFATPPARNLEQAAYTAWCIFLDTLHCASEKNLIRIATHEVFLHFYIGLYPRANNDKTRTHGNLRLQALVKLRKCWGFMAELKESFTTEDDNCVFSIRLKSPGYSWQTLATATAPRLKLARFEAYTLLIDEIKNGQHRPETAAATRLPPLKE